MRCSFAFLIADRCRLQCLGLALLLYCIPTWAAPDVILLLSEPGGIYQEAASALETELQQAGFEVAQQSLEQRGEPRAGGWVVVLGVTALQHALAEHSVTPVFSLLVPRTSYFKLVADQTRPVTALYLDQPLERMAALQRLALPDNRQMGVLLGPVLRNLPSELERAAVSQGLDLHYREITASADVFQALTELTKVVEMLWLLPEPMVVNRNNLQSLFLQTYSRRCPVLAYSSELVKTGALLGLYATPEQLGREAGQWLKSLLRAESRKPPPPRYPVSFTVGVNTSVARSLNLNVPTADELTRRLRSLHIP